VLADTWSTGKREIEIDGKTKVIDIAKRRIDQVHLFEVSAVTFPAYPDTDAGLAKRALGDLTNATRNRPVNLGSHDDRAQALAIRYRLPN